MQKKFLVFGLAAAMLLSACGSSSSDDSSSQTDDSKTSQTTDSSSSNSSDSSGSSDAADSSGSSDSSDTSSDGQGTLGDYAVVIESMTVENDYEGNPAAVITYSFTNNGDDEQSFLTALSAEVYQNGVQLQTAIMDDVDTSSSMTNIKPGVTLEVVEAYSLNDDTSPIDVEVSELFSMSSDEVTKTFDISQ
jgi:hypothetical protein